MSELISHFLIFVVYPIVLVASIPAGVFGLFWVKEKLFRRHDTFGQEK
jgi:hypothetical protein